MLTVDYIIIVLVKIRIGLNRTRTLNTSYALHTATPPTLGTCSVTPTRGIFMQDKFAVNCSGFRDPSPPLTYTFYVDPGEYNTPSQFGRL